MGEINSIIKIAKEYDLLVALIMPVPFYKKSVPRMVWEKYKSDKPLPSFNISDYNKKYEKMYKSLTQISYDKFRLYDSVGYFCNNVSVL